MSDDKTEEPTEHKLKTAREEGQVARSTDIVVAASMLAVVGTLLLSADATFNRLRAMLEIALQSSASDLALDTIYKRIATMALDGVMVIVPLAAAAAFGAVVGAVLHIGFGLSPKAVHLKLSAIDPVQGMKKVVSVKSLLTLMQMLLKAVILGVVMWCAIESLLPLIGAALFQSSGTISSLAWSATGKILLFASVLFAVLAPIDYAIERRHFMKGQRMSKDEVKREHKSQEGNPEVKGRRREMAQEFAEEQPAQALKTADALIVNPTHYAVAVRYRVGEVGLPVVVVSAVDERALRLREQALALGVPIFAHPPLARALSRVPVGAAVPEELFEVVAVVLRWVDDIGAPRDDDDTHASVAALPA